MKKLKKKLEECLAIVKRMEDDLKGCGMDVKIGDTVTLVSPSSGKTKDVTVTDVIRDVFERKVLAIEFNGVNGLAQLSVEYFRKPA